MLTNLSIPELDAPGQTRSDLEEWFKENIQTHFSANNDVNKMAAALKLARVLNDESSLSSIVDESLGFNVLHKAAQSGFDKFLEKCWQSQEEAFLLAMHQTSKNGNTALHLAALGGHATVIDVLLKAKANPQTLNTKRHSPIYYVANRTGIESEFVENERLESLKLLLGHDLSPLKQCDYSGIPLFLNLAKFKTQAWVEFIESCIKQDHELQCLVDNQDQNVLHHAILNKHAALITQLTQYKTLLFKSDKNNSHPLLHACRYANPEIVKILLEKPLCKKPKYLAQLDVHNQTAEGYFGAQLLQLPEIERGNYQGIADSLRVIEPSIAPNFNV